MDTLLLEVILGYIRSFHSTTSKYFSIGIMLTPSCLGICIDQVDTFNEKDGQIALLDDVYHLAISVIISLGPALPEDGRVMEFIRTLTKPPYLNRIGKWFSDLYATVDERRNDDRAETWLEWTQAMIIWKFYA